jgi:hypothetical protein
MRRSNRRGVGEAVALAGIVLLAVASGAGSARSERSATRGVRPTSLATSSVGPVPSERRAAAAAATWCGTPTQQDLAPNATAGDAVHWIYAIPSDGADRFSAFASAMQTDAELIDAWWRGQDSTRTPRDDLARFPCGTQLDLSSVRLALPASRLDNAARFEEIVDGIVAAGFSSTFVKYVVYYDGTISEQGLCGQGGSDTTGFGVAVVFTRSCSGIAPSVIAAHELLHTLGAVPVGAPHDCPPPNNGHTCDTKSDIMYPFVSPVPLSSEILDPGRDDYYGHSGSWPDVQDSHWLVQLDRQVPFSLAIAGPGSVTADVPGLLCDRTCSTTWNAGTQLNLAATPAVGAKLVRWTGSCTGAGACSVTVDQGAKVSALFAPATYRLTVSRVGHGTVRSARSGISCTPRCSAAFPSYVSLQLRATPARGWRFRGWSGACRGARNVCTVPMTKNTSARAVFVRP